MERAKLQRIALSVLIAAALWLSVKLVQDYRTTLQQPVRYSNLPPRLALASPLPSTLGVTYEGRGHRLMLKALTIRRDTLTLDVPPEAVRRGFLLTSDLRLAVASETQLTVRHIGPDTLPLAFERRIVKRVPVRPRLDLQYAEGFLPNGPVRLTPDSVQLLGTARSLANITSWTTQPVRRQDVHTDQHLVLDLAPDPSIVISPQRVIFDLAVAKYTEDTVRVPVQRLGLQPGQYLRLSPEAVLLRFRVPFARAGSITAAAFTVAVDVRQMDPQAQILIPRVLRSPPGVRDIRIEPAYLNFVLGTDRRIIYSAPQP